jgi:hypothetical protein
LTQADAAALEEAADDVVLAVGVVAGQHRAGLIVGWPVKVAGQPGSIGEHDGKIPFYLNVIRGLLSHFSPCPGPSAAAGHYRQLWLMSICSQDARLFDLSMSGAPIVGKGQERDGSCVGERAWPGLAKSVPGLATAS